jgi:iron complex outermembrane receptor protein
MPKKNALHRNALFLAMSVALSSSIAVAQTESHEGHEDPTDLERITVSALPIEKTSLESAKPISVLAGEALDDKRGMTIGETLANEPGVHSSYYGPGSARPIIRGLAGPRISILEDGLSVGDASAPSDDHAIAYEPLLVDRIEILRGPATLLYGTGASGGVVNLIDNRIAETLPDSAFSGRYELRGDTVADERSGVVRFNGAAGNLAWHIDGAWRETDDYEIPGMAERHDGHDHDHDDHDDGEHGDEESGILPNSFVESQSGTLGLSYIGQRGFIGASFRRFDSEYGIPAPHSHGDEEDHDDEEHDGDEHEHGEEDEFAFIDLEQERFDISAGLDNPLPGFTRASFRFGMNDYIHQEIEMEGEEHGDENHDDDHDHEHTPTTFDVENSQARLELQNETIFGFNGAIGLQYNEEDFQAIGEEAFVPPNQTESLALFFLQERQFGDVTFSLGGRIEQFDVQADFSGMDDHDHEHDDHDHDDDHGELPDVEFDIDQRDFTNYSFGIGAVWQMSALWQSSFDVSRTERAPLAAELFSNGEHLATFSFEIGDPTLDKETTLAWDVGLHRHSENFDFDINLFYKQVDDFIYLADTGLEVDDFDVRIAAQEDAKLYGLETQATWQIHDTAFGDFDLIAAYDYVRGELDAGGNLPRMSPQRLSSGIRWYQGPWRAGLDWQRVFRQDDVAEFESETPGYNLINARLAYSFNLGAMPMEAYISGHNLGNNEARVHTSFLRDFAPLPGRNVRFGLRGEF